MSSICSSFSTHPLTHVKMDAKSFNHLIIKKVRSFHPKPGIRKDDWNKVADALREIFQRTLNVLLYRDTFDILISDATNEVFRVCGEHPQLNSILSKVLKTYRNTFEDITIRSLDDMQFKELLILYHHLIKKTMNPNSNYRKRFLENWPLESKPTFDFRDVDIELDLETISQIYQKSGVLQLRELNPDARVLIIGCGNGRFSNDGNSLLEYGLKAQAKYSLAHNHPRNVVTVDADLTANPTIVAVVGFQPISRLFKYHRFDRILLEDFSLEAMNEFLLEDLKKLLSRNGIIRDKYRVLFSKDPTS